MRKQPINFNQIHNRGMKMTIKKISNCTNGCNWQVYSEGLCQRCLSGDKCDIKGCGKPVASLKWCAKHYRRFYLYGDPRTKFALRVTAKTEELKFWKRVAITSNIEKCWEWLGAISGGTGYGIAEYKNKLQGCHRIAWQIANKRKPTKFILHSCDNRSCVNPNHLREGTHRDNMKDAVSRDRMAKGEEFVSSKLSEKEVRKIKQMLRNGVSGNKIANQYGVVRGTIYAIKHGKTWRHIEI